MTGISEEEPLIKLLILILFFVCTSIISFKVCYLNMVNYAFLIHYLRMFLCLAVFLLKIN